MKAAAFNNLIPELLVSSQFLLLLVCLNPRSSSFASPEVVEEPGLHADTHLRVSGAIRCQLFCLWPSQQSFPFLLKCCRLSCISGVESVCRDEFSVATSPSWAAEAGLALARLAPCLPACLPASRAARSSLVGRAARSPSRLL